MLFLGWFLAAGCVGDGDGGTFVPVTTGVTVTPQGRSRWIVAQSGVGKSKILK